MQTLEQFNFFYAQLSQAYEVAYKSASLCAPMVNPVSNFLDALKNDVAELEQKNAELEQKNAELEQKNAELEQKNAELEQKNAADIREPAA